MGFFSKKTPPAKSPLLALVESKIHIMQDDLDEIARKEKLAIAPPPEAPKLAKKILEHEEPQNKEALPFPMPLPPLPSKEPIEIESNQKQIVSDIEKPKELKIQEIKKIEKPKEQTPTSPRQTSPFFSPPKPKGYQKPDISKPESKVATPQDSIRQNNVEKQTEEIQKPQKEIPLQDIFSEPEEQKLPEISPEQPEEKRLSLPDQEPVLQQEEEFISTEEQPRHVLFSFASKVFELLVELLKTKIDKAKETKVQQGPREISSKESEIREIRRSTPQSSATPPNLTSTVTPTPQPIPQVPSPQKSPPLSIQQSNPQYDNHDNKKELSSQKTEIYPNNQLLKTKDGGNISDIHSLPQNFHQIGPEFPDKKFGETESNVSMEKTSWSQTEEKNIRTGAWPVQRKGDTIDQKSRSVDMGIKPRKKTLDKDALFSENIILKKSWGWKKYLLIFIFLFALGGGIFFLRETNPTFFEFFDTFSTSSKKIPDIIGNPSAENLLNKETPKENLPFSITQPNSFVVDVEKETVSTIQEKILKYAETMKNADMKVPVLFSVVDKTNTPIAFFVFASIFNLGLSPSLLNNLDDEFYLAILIDNGEPRLALNIQIKDTEKTKKTILLSEKSLHVSLKNLFLSKDTLPIKTPVFNNGSYRNIPIRFLNLSEDASLSIDYVFIKKSLVISTSKEMTHAMINRLLDF